MKTKLPTLNERLRKDYHHILDRDAVEDCIDIVKAHIEHYKKEAKEKREELTRKYDGDGWLARSYGKGYWEPKIEALKGLL